MNHFISSAYIQRLFPFVEICKSKLCESETLGKDSSSQNILHKFKNYLHLQAAY